MVRGLVYSFVAICLFLLVCIVWMTVGGVTEEAAYTMSGWLLLLCFFLVGPVFFGLGYWHHLRLTPGEPHWDPEIGE
jgi:hypothetical protein